MVVVGVVVVVVVVVDHLHEKLPAFAQVVCIDPGLEVITRAWFAAEAVRASERGSNPLDKQGILARSNFKQRVDLRIQWVVSCKGGPLSECLHRVCRHRASKTSASCRGR